MPVGCIIANRNLALSAERTGTKEDKGSTMMLSTYVAAVVDEKPNLRMK